jgi:hypothetical protein
VGRLHKLRRNIRAFALLGIAVLLASGCGGGGGARQSIPSRPGLQTIFEAPAELLVDPARTLDVARRLGVDQVRVSVAWDTLAPHPNSRAAPKSFDGGSPAAYPAAGWAPYDAIVRAAAQRGVGVDLSLAGQPPLWASGPGAPRAGGPHPQWKPSAREYGAFVRAVATRYSGSYKPAGASSPLPRVSFWSIWNEPNYGPDLAPQAVDQSSVEVSPRLYRGLLDAGWRALQATGHGADTILIGELAPRGITTGNNPGNFSGMVPLRFVRALYCVDSSFHVLQGIAAAERGCPRDASSSSHFAAAHPALFKAGGFAVHPYPQGAPPNVSAPSEPDYADLPSLPRVEATLDRVQEIYGSPTRFKLYSTEYGYKTNPPYSLGLSLPTAAAYLNWAEYLSWKNPRMVAWNQYLLADPPPANSSFDTGIEFVDGTPKPFVYDAFRMPIYLPVTSAKHGQSVEVWGCVRPARYAGLADGRGQVANIQFKAPGDRAFRTIKSVTVTDPYGYLDVRIPLPGTGLVRLAWTYPHGETIQSRSVAVTTR